jgi:phosphatidylglycerol:prolipoprotein diacylglycerol transferase
MYPVICQIGPFPIYAFGLMFLLALVVCSFLLAREAKTKGLSSEEIYDFVFWVVIGGIIGARVFFIGLNFQFFVENPAEIIKLNKGGLAWQGGLILGLLAGILYSWRLKVPMFFMADLAVPYLALGQAIGRLGCFLNGCCYGRPVAWGIYFPAHDARLHPTQLYDFGGLVLIFFILKFSQRFFQKQGQVFSFYLVLASLERFVNEFFRADHTVAYAGLSIFQLVSILLFFSGTVLLFIQQAKSPAKISRVRRI